MISKDSVSAAGAEPVSLTELCSTAGADQAVLQLFQLAFELPEFCFCGVCRFHS